MALSPLQSSKMVGRMVPDKRGDARQIGTHATESLELRLAVIDRLGDSGRSAVRSLGSYMLVSWLGLLVGLVLGLGILLLTFCGMSPVI